MRIAVISSMHDVSLFWRFISRNQNMKSSRTSGHEVNTKPLKYLVTYDACCLIQWCERNAHAFQELDWLHAIVVER